MVTGKAGPRWVDPLIAAGLAVAFTALLLGSVGDLGYARDEGFYFMAADRYAAWFQLLASDWRAAVDRRAVDAAWTVNHEHPALIKSLFALSSLVLHKKLGLFAMPGTSYRFPAMVLSGIGVALVYLWGAQARGRAAGLAAAALFAALPRYFYHAHLACFDAPIVTVWALCAYCYWRSLRDGGRAWPLLCGLTFGLALNTKHNSWFLPIVCGAHAAAIQIRAWLAKEPAPEGPANAGSRSPAETRRRALAALGAMAVLGPAVLYATWPWIWSDTLPRLREYALFHLEHEYYNMELFGVSYWKPPMPRSYAFVMTAATVPAITLVLAGLGLFRAARAGLGVWGARLAWLRARAAADPAGTALLWFLGIAAIYAAWLSPKTPIFGGTKHWMTAYPFLALFAGSAFAEVARRASVALRRAASGRPRVAIMRRIGRGPLPAVALGAAVIAAPAAETWHAHPWALSAYTPLVGGASGAATLGLNRTFWGYTTGAVVDYLNAEVPPRGSVYIHDTAWPAWEMLLKDGRLRKDIRGVGTVAGADFALYHHEKHMLGQAYQAWVAFGTTRPDHIGGLDGVPVILVYRAR